jgi:hypothetical protein
MDIISLFFFSVLKMCSKRWVLKLTLLHIKLNRNYKYTRQMFVCTMTDRHLSCGWFITHDRKIVLVFEPYHFLFYVKCIEACFITDSFVRQKFLTQHIVCMEYSPSWYADSPCSSREITGLLWSRKVHYCVRYSAPLDPILRHTNISVLSADFASRFYSKVPYAFPFSPMEVT